MNLNIKYLDSMEPKIILNYVVIAIAVVMCVSILLQIRGSGIGSLFGSAGGDFFRSRRGMEKFLFNLTIVTAVLFVASCITIVLLNRTT